MPKRVCMTVNNDITHDARIDREAKALSQAGFNVTLVGTLSKDTVPKEELDSVKIVQVPVETWHGVQKEGINKTLNFYRTFLSWVEKDPEINIMIKQKKTEIFTLFLGFIII